MKNFLIFVLIFFLFSSTVCAAFVDRGDVNLDGVVDIRDVVLVQRYILGIGELSSDEFVRADTNMDGILDIRDLLFIIKVLILEIEDPELKDPSSR